MRHKKHSLHILVCGLLAVAAVVGLLRLNSAVATKPVRVGGEAPKAVVYRSPTCGCCGIYATYLKKMGFEVETKFAEAGERAKLGVPERLGSCHTTVVGGYTIEGHVPVEAIEKLLTEKPDVKGIGMPGMPSGSPGMPGPKLGAFEVSSFKEDGSVADYLAL